MKPIYISRCHLRKSKFKSHFICRRRKIYRWQFNILCRLKGKVLLKGRRITDKKEDYYRGNADDDTDSDDDSEIDKKHTNRDDEPVSHVCFLLVVWNITTFLNLKISYSTAEPQDELFSTRVDIILCRTLEDNDISRCENEHIWRKPSKGQRLYVIYQRVEGEETKQDRRKQGRMGGIQQYAFVSSLSFGETSWLQ